MLTAVSTMRLLAIYAFVQVLLYCSLTPLWEGFDEAYHFGYVESLALRRELPVQGQSSLTEEIWQSMQLAPASHLVVQNVRVSLSFSDYFALPAAERNRRRAKLEKIPSALAVEPAGGDNYEAQQAPLTYLALAPVEWLGAASPIMARVWRLRLFGALASLALLLYTVIKLAERVEMPAAYRNAACFFLLSTQSLYGAVAHVANDWLSLPLLALLLLAADRFWQRPEVGPASWLAAVLAAGLLTKSYFLIFVPVVLAVVALRALPQVVLFVAIVLAAAGPWYFRNVMLYGSLTGLQSSVRGVSSGAMLEAVSRTNWPDALLGMARAGLWCGNGSFTAFSSSTLNTILALLTIGCLLSWRVLRGKGATLWLVLGGTLIFSLIPVYAMVLFGAMHGHVHPASNPWYTAALLPGVLLAAFAGCAAYPGAGRVLARGLIALASFVAVVTYFGKLIPAYAGFEGPARGPLLYSTYVEQLAEVVTRLDQSALTGGAWILILAGMHAVIAIVLCLRLWRGLSSGRSLRLESNRDYAAQPLMRSVPTPALSCSPDTSAGGALLKDPAW